MNFSSTQIQQLTKGDFFGVGNAQLPSDQMLMIDEIETLSFEGGKYDRGYLEARFAINPHQWFFACHFEGDPVMPGCLGLDALWQLAGVFLGAKGLPGKGRALGVGKVTFRGQIYPSTREIRYRLDIKRVIAKPLAMVIADGLVIDSDTPIYSAENLKVGLLNP